jgi:hypothetical protein
LQYLNYSPKPQKTKAMKWLNKNNALYERWLSETPTDHMTNYEAIIATIAAVVFFLFLGWAATL